MKYYLITGVSTGIGKDACEYLINKGNFVFGSVRKAADANALENKYPNKFKALIFDVTDDAAIANALTVVKQTIGNQGLAGLINNAGIAVFGPLKHLPLEEFKQQMDVNVYGVLRVTQTFLPLLGAEKDSPYPPGKIINISSVASLFTSPFVVPYCASKAVVEVISDGLRMELLPYGIDVVSIKPGPVKTPIWEKSKKPKPQYDNTDYGKALKNTMKMVAKIESKAIDVQRISRLIYGILNGTKRKPHYVITANPWPMRIARMLPHRWVDGFIKKQLMKAWN